MVPLWFVGAIMQNPHGLLSKVFSYIPFFSPTTMLFRLGISSPSWMEIIATLIIIIITNYLFIRLASKIFRLGMLMYGKNISIKEMVK